jgi:hypothetical protein
MADASGSGEGGGDGGGDGGGGTDSGLKIQFDDGIAPARILSRTDKDLIVSEEKHSGVDDDMEQARKIAEQDLEGGRKQVRTREGSRPTTS